MDLQRLEVAVYRALPERLKGRAIRLGTPNFTVGSLAWLTDGQGRVLLSRPTYRKGWLPTGGFLRKGETPLRTVVREIGEELGVTAQVAPHHRVAFDVQRRGVTFVSVGLLDPSAELRLSPEVESTRWFALDEVPPFPRDFTEGFTDEDRAAIAAVRPSRPPA